MSTFLELPLYTFEVEDREVEVEDEGEKLKEVSEDQNMGWSGLI